MTDRAHTMEHVALVTGASGGIGRELAVVHAREGGDLILVARSEHKLDALARDLSETYGVQARVIPADLSSPDAPERLFAAVSALGVEIDVLVNNAGFGGYGPFHETDVTRNAEMIQLNIGALTELTRRFLPDMIRRGRGRVLNVASAAGFVPGPLQAVYYATKAYVVSFTEAISNELEGTGVTATALCPGATQTDFAARGNLENVALFKNAAPANEVAEFGYRAMEKGKAVVVHGVTNRLGVLLLPRLLPRGAITKISRSVMEKAT